MTKLRQTLALLDKDLETLEADLLNPEIKDIDGILRVINSNTGDWLTLIDNTVRIVQWLGIEEKYVRNHVHYLENNARTMKERSTIIRQAVVASMLKRNELNPLKFPATGVSVSIRDLEDEITVEDESKIPDEFKKIVPAHFEVDLQKYKEHFKKTGELVDGFKVERNRKTLVVR